MIMDTDENDMFDLNDSGFVDDIKSENDVEMSAYEKIRMDNIKERQKMLENLKIEDEKKNCLMSSSVRKYDKRKAKTVNKSVKRKSVRIAEKREFEANFLPNEDEDDPDWQVTSNSRKKAVSKNRVTRCKIENFEETNLIFNVSFTSPDNSDKKLFISYWS